MLAVRLWVVERGREGERMLAHTDTHSTHRLHPPNTVVLNLPVVPTEKYDKLAAVIKKIYGSIGSIREGE